MGSSCNLRNFINSNKIALILMRDKDETKRERTIIRVLREKERQVFGDGNKNMYKINRYD